MWIDKGEKSVYVCCCNKPVVKIKRKPEQVLKRNLGNRKKKRVSSSANVPFYAFAIVSACVNLLYYHYAQFNRRHRIKKTDFSMEHPIRKLHQSP